jgi:hypothetical protein
MILGKCFAMNRRECREQESWSISDARAKPWKGYAANSLACPKSRAHHLHLMENQHQVAGDGPALYCIFYVDRL